LLNKNSRFGEKDNKVRPWAAPVQLHAEGVGRVGGREAVEAQTTSYKGNLRVGDDSPDESKGSNKIMNFNVW